MLAKAPRSRVNPDGFPSADRTDPQSQREALSARLFDLDPMSRVFDGVLENIFGGVTGPTGPLPPIASTISRVLFGCSSSCSDAAHERGVGRRAG